EESTMCVVHLEPEEFVSQVYKSHAKIDFRVYPMDNTIAVLVYCIRDGQTLYYMDRALASTQKQALIDEMNSDERHAELYRKVALDERLRFNGSCSPL
ncbi:hypothetical protein, partial [uncultured Dubosiella sp.]